MYIRNSSLYFNPYPIIYFLQQKLNRIARFIGGTGREKKSLSEAFEMEELWPVLANEEMRKLGSFFRK
jgi:hypothetical protein